MTLSQKSKTKASQTKMKPNSYSQWFRHVIPRTRDMAMELCVQTHPLLHSMRPQGEGRGGEGWDDE